MQLNVVRSAEGTGSVDLADNAFAADYNEALVHQVVVAYMAGAAEAPSRENPAPKYAAAERNLGARKGSDAPGPEAFGVRSGVAGVRHSRRNPETSLRR